MSYDIASGRWKCSCGAMDHHSCICPSSAPVIRDVHTEHCCFMHGCKYMGGTDCTVTSGEKPQSHPCETCDFELYEAGDWELAHLINDMITKERDRLDTVVGTLAQVWMNSDTGSHIEHMAEDGLRDLLGPDWYRICKKRSHF